MSFWRRKTKERGFLQRLLSDACAPGGCPREFNWRWMRDDQNSNVLFKNENQAASADGWSCDIALRRAGRRAIKERRSSQKRLARAHLLHRYRADQSGRSANAVLQRLAQGQGGYHQHVLYDLHERVPSDGKVTREDPGIAGRSHGQGCSHHLYERGP